MRATSVIFLILSVVLALIGLVTCGIGASLAEEQGIALFDQVADENNNLISTYNYTGDGIKKIAIEVGDADVHIYGGSETAYIELINFTEGSYALSSTNLSLSVTDNSSLLKLFSWGSEGINFDGFRHYLHSLDFADKPRTINIYVTSDSAVKLFDIKLENGALTMQDVRFTFDMTVGVGEGSITMENLKTTSDLSMTLEKGNISLDTVAVRNLTIEAGEGGVDMELVYAMQGITASLRVGDIRLASAEDGLPDKRVRLSAPLGTIRYFGESAGRSYSADDTDDEDCTVTLAAENGDIVVE